MTGIAVRFPKTASILAAMLGALALGLQRATQWVDGFIAAQVVFVLLAAYFPLLLRFMFERLNRIAYFIEQISASPESDLPWWKNVVGSMFGGWPPYLLGILLMAGGLPTIRWAGVPWSGLNLLIYDVASGAVLFLAGVSGWAFIRLLSSLRGLSALSLRVLPFYWPQAEIAAIHRMLMQVFAGGLVAYFLGVLGIGLSPSGVWYLFHGVVGGWILPLSMAVVLFFIAIEYHIHRLLEAVKRERLRQLSLTLQGRYEHWSQLGDKESAAAVTEVLKWCDSVRAEKSWPLDFVAMVSIIVGIFIPAVKSIKELFLR
ncbi:MAG: hypothetical protein WAM82_08045 [Thermoanaerobaculia bacterium]